MKKELFRSREGMDVEVYTLENKNGMRVRVLSFGASIMEILAPDRNGALAPVLLSYDTPQGFIDGRCYFGATVGRYANRIARGRFEIDGAVCQVPQNEGRNHLHGGLRGMTYVPWSAQPMDGESVRFTRESPDGEEGYPGNLTASVQFTLDDDNALWLRYAARVDRPCPVNLTNHAYFNLAGHDAGDVGGHWLRIAADEYTPVDAEFIPTGEVASVEGTPLDFREARRIGERIDTDFEQLKLAGGYDHNFVLSGSGLREIARVYEPVGGRRMTVLTDKPCVQLYTGNMMGGIAGMGGAVYGKRGALCLETQFAPDSPNQPQFPSAILRPGEAYDYTTCYRFDAADGIDGQGGI